jgi:hypothetical protein
MLELDACAKKYYFVLSLVKHQFVILLLSPTLSDQKLIMYQQLKQILVQSDTAHIGI